MLARVVMTQGKPEKVDEVARYFKDQTLVNAKKIKGFHQAFMMANRQSGRIVATVQWENQQAIEDSTPLATKAIGQMAQIAGATQEPMVEVYEVVVAEVPTMIGMK